MGAGFLQGNCTCAASYYVEGFNRVVGNPEAGPFAIYFSSNREPRLTGAFGPKLTLI